MVSQAERRASTIGAIEDAARKLFAARGFADTTIDDIAARAGVAKGAVYHHFSSKEEIFTRVLEVVQQELAAAQVPSAQARKREPLDLLAAGILNYLLSISEPGIRTIVLIDGPTVLGWQKWREIDMRHFGALTTAALSNVLGSGVSPRVIEPLVHLLMGAIMEAALICATSSDPRKRAKELTEGIRAMVEGLAHAHPTP